MPLSLHYTDDGDGFILSATGRTTGSDFIDLTRTMAADEDRIKTLKFALVDLSDVAEFDVSADEVRRIAALDQRIAAVNPHSIVAFVATRRVVVGLLRMWELLGARGGWAIRICSARAEAES